MYRSSHNPVLPPSASTFHQRNTTNPKVSNIGGDAPAKIIQDKDSRTFGKVPGSYKEDPLAYMQKSLKNERVATLSEVKRDAPHVLQPTVLKARLKGPSPRRDEIPVMNLVSSKNFVVANAVENILAVPKKLQQASKDYLGKEDYGKVPKYLSHVKKDIEAEYDYIRALEQQREEMNRSQVRQLDENDRGELICQLKAKWEKTNTEYQATTHLTKLDTIGKTKRKENYESELAQIEKDIEKLNRKNIMIRELA